MICVNQNSIFHFLKNYRGLTNRQHRSVRHLVKLNTRGGKKGNKSFVVVVSWLPFRYGRKGKKWKVPQWVQQVGQFGLRYLGSLFISAASGAAASSFIPASRTPQNVATIWHSAMYTLHRGSKNFSWKN